MFNIFRKPFLKNNEGFIENHFTFLDPFSNHHTGYLPKLEKNILIYVQIFLQNDWFSKKKRSSNTSTKL